MRNMISEITEFETLLSNVKLGDYDSNPSLERMLELVCYISKIVIKNLNNQNKILSPIELIFDKSNSEQRKKSASACLLRILCSKDSIIFENKDLRIKTFDLFDESINYLYKRLNIDKNNENHIKLSKLKDLEDRLLNEFNTFTQSFSNLNNPISIREKYISEIYNPLTNLFLESFVESNLIDRYRLNDVFKVTENYFNAIGSDKLEFYDKAFETYENYLNDVKNEPSIFAKKCLLEPINIIYSRIKSDFDNIGIIKPAKLSIKDTQRKYALHENDKNLEIKYIILNEGPGYAFDVEIEIQDMEGIEISNKIINLGNLQPGKTEIIFDSIVHKSKSIANYRIIGQLSWKNYKEPKRIHKYFFFELISQRADIDWD